MPKLIHLTDPECNAQVPSSLNSLITGANTSGDRGVGDCRNTQHPVTLFAWVVEYKLIPISIEDPPKFLTQ